MNKDIQEPTSQRVNEKLVYYINNGIRILRCYPLNWEIHERYAVKTKPNPEFFYTISVGSIGDIWQASLIPETMILSFTSLHYSKSEVYRFKVDTFEEASEMVLKFAKGMQQIENLEHTIYWNK